MPTLEIPVEHEGSLKNCPPGEIVDEVESAMVFAVAGFVATPFAFWVWMVILGEQSPTRTVKAEVENASFVAGEDVTSDVFADAASAVMSGFVALTLKG